MNEPFRFSIIYLYNTNIITLFVLNQILGLHSLNLEDFFYRKKKQNTGFLFYLNLKNIDKTGVELYTINN